MRPTRLILFSCKALVADVVACTMREAVIVVPNCGPNIFANPSMMPTDRSVGVESTFSARTPPPFFAIATMSMKVPPTSTPMTNSGGAIVCFMILFKQKR